MQDLIANYKMTGTADELKPIIEALYDLKKAVNGATIAGLRAINEDD